MGELIGVVDLEVGVNLGPLDAGLKKAELKVAQAAAVMQRLLDRHVNVSSDQLGALASLMETRLEKPLLSLGGAVAKMTADGTAGFAAMKVEQEALASAFEHTAAVAVAASDVEVAASDRVTTAYLEQAAAARLAAEAGDAALARGIGGDVLAAAGRGGVSSGGGGGAALAGLAGLEGVRGRGHAGSRSNPLVVVLEAGRYTSLGGLAAAVAEQGITSAGTSPGGSSGPLWVPPGRGGQQSGSSTVVAGGGSDQRDRVAADTALGLATARLADVLEKSAAQQKKAPPLVVPPAGQQPVSPGGVILPGGRGGQKSEPVPVVVKDQDPRIAGDEADALVAAMASKGRTGSELAPGQMASSALSDYYAAKGFTSAVAPDGRLRLYGSGGAPGTRAFGSIPGAVPGAVPGGGEGGGGIPPWLLPVLWGHGHSGGGGGGRPPGWLGYLLKSGMVGAGFGSLGSFAGFGPEHVLMTAGGIAGSGAAALGGGALLGGAALAKTAVGAGSDAAVMHATVSGAKALEVAYENLHTAIAVYGAGSEKAVEAQKELDKVMVELGNTAGTKAEEGVAKAAKALHEFWLAQTSGARVQGAKILMQDIGLGHDFVPLIAKAAEENLAVTNKGLKPLFAWLEGPEGMGIFLQLERMFKEELPSSLDALDKGVQFFGKTISFVAPMTGGLVKDLDAFFNKMDEPKEFQKWEGSMTRLIEDFHVWGRFMKSLGGTLVDLFDKDAHTGESIVIVLTEMLDKAREYENSTKGSEQIRNLFLVHREEIIALLKLLPPLIGGFSDIYMTVAPPLVEAVTGIANAFAWLLETVDQAGPLGRWALGLAIIAGKLKILVPLLKAAGIETGILSGEQTAAAGAARKEAAGTEALTGAESGFVVGSGGTAVAATRTKAGTLGTADEAAMAAEGDTGLLGGLALSGGAKSLLLKGGLGGFLGLMGGSLAAGATGAHGTLGTAISGAGAGAGAGFTLGPAAGALLGTEIAPVVGTAIGAGLGFAAPYAVKFLSSVFSEHAPDYGKQFAQRFIAPFGTVLVPEVADHYRKALDSAQNRVQGARNNLNEALQANRDRGEVHPSAKVRREEAPERAAIVAAEGHLGEVAAQAFVAGWQHVKFPSKTALLFDMQHSLSQLPGTARNAAAKAMLAYATELEAKGQIPKHAVASLLHQLEGQFPGLATYLQQQGDSTAKAFSHALELREAKAQLTNSLDQVEQQFGLFTDHSISGATQALDAVERIVHEKKGPAKKAAEEYGENLRYAIMHQLELTKGGAGNLVEEMNARVDLGLETFSQGIAKVNKMLESELGALGIHSKIGTNKSGELTFKSPNVFTTGIGGEPLPSGKSKKGAAGGGAWQIGRPGEAGRDTVPMSIGGESIMVGGGEVAAVFNRHQMPEVNAALVERGYDGGLAGLFDSVNTPNYMASGGVIGEIVSTGLKDVRSAANKKLHAAKAKAHEMASGGGGPVPSGTVRQWLTEALKITGHYSLANLSALYGRTMQESGGNPHAINLTDSNAKAGHPSKGILQTIPETFAAYMLPGHGDIWNPVDNAIAAIRYMFKEYGHIVGPSSTGYAGGGVVRGFAGGGLPQVIGQHAQPVTTGFGKSANKNPKGAKKPSRNYSGPLTVPWNPTENKGLYDLGELLETGIPAAQETYSNLVNKFSLNEYGSGLLSFIVNEGPLGESVTPYEDLANVNARLGQLNSLVDAETHYKQLLEQGRSSAGVLRGWVEKEIAARHKRIKELNKAIDIIRAKIEANLKTLAALEKARESKKTKNKSAITSVEQQLEVAYNAKHPDRKRIGELKSDLRGLRGQDSTAELDKQIAAIHAENKKLGGDESALGSGGELGKLDTRRSTAQSQLTVLGERRSSIDSDVRGIQGAGGEGGSLGEAVLTLGQLGKQMEELSPGSLATTLAKANAQSAPSAGSESVLSGLLKEQNLQLSQAFAVSQAQYKALQNFPDFGGSFSEGGIVPGPLGSSKLIEAHGGEVVSKAGATPELHLHFANGMEWLRGMIRVEVKQSTRGMGRSASRPLPSRGGGQLG